jgi:hypothetical protein
MGDGDAASHTETANNFIAREKSKYSTGVSFVELPAMEVDAPHAKPVTVFRFRSAGFSPASTPLGFLTNARQIPSEFGSQIDGRGWSRLEAGANSSGCGRAIDWHG